MAESKMVKRWFATAADDLKMAKYSLEASPTFKEISAFHSQQCAEKAIKGFLAFRKIRFSKTHKLEELAKDVSKVDLTLSKIILKYQKLNDFAVAYRYPDAQRKPLVLNRAKQAIKQAELIYGECLSRVSD